MASMRDGCGGEWIVWFSENIAGYKCISPEDGLIDNLQSIIKNVPKEYSEFINEPAFSMDMATCIWFYKDEQWIKHGKSIEWLIDLNNIIAWKAKDYYAWAIEYYECEIDLTIVHSIFNGTINKTLIKKLNPQIIMNDLLEETEEMGIVF